jgi:hypothetical protein
MCTVLLSMGVNPIAVNKYIISHHNIISFHYRSVFPMPRLTPDYDRIMVYRLLTADTTQFDMLSIFRMIQMIMEFRISEDYCRSDIQIIDMSFVSMVHISKITLPLLKKYEMCAFVSTALNILITGFIRLHSYFQDTGLQFLRFLTTYKQRMLSVLLRVSSHHF